MLPSLVRGAVLAGAAGLVAALPSSVVLPAGLGAFAAVLATSAGDAVQNTRRSNRTVGVEGADASAVYQFDLAGVGAEAPGATGRFAMGAAALALAAAAGVVLRRRVVVLPEAAHVVVDDRVTV